MSLSARLARLVVTRPVRVLVAALVVTLALVPLALRLRLDTDIVKLVPDNRVEAQAFARFARSFVAEQVLIILAQSDDPERLIRFADDYADQLRREEQVLEVRHRLGAEAANYLKQHLLGLLTLDEIDALGLRLGPDALRTQARRLRTLLSAPGGSALAPVLTTDPLELLPVLGKRLSSGLPVDTTTGHFMSADRKALLLYVRPRTGSFDVEADRRLLATAGRLAEALGARVSDGSELATEPPKGLRVGFTGACAYTLAYRDWLHRDASWSTPLSALAVLLLFGVLFRSLRVLPLVAIPLGVGLLWTAAAAVAFYGRVNAVSLSFGTILLSIGIDFPIQIYNRLREELASHPPLVALERTIEALAVPSLLATLGPAVVFGACALSSYRGLSELGLLSALGLCLNLVAMLTVLPSLLALLPPRLWTGRAPAAAVDPASSSTMAPAVPPSGLLARLGRLASRRPRATLAVALGVTLAALPAARRIRFDDRLLSIHPEGMPPVRVEAELSRRFGERERMLIALVESPDPQRALEQSDRWAVEADRLRQQGLLRGIQSASSLFPSNKTQEERAARLRALHPAAAATALREALVDLGFDAAPFEGFLGHLASFEVAPGQPGGPQLLSLDEAKSGDLGFLTANHVHDSPEGRSVATFLFPAPGVDGAALDAALRQISTQQGGVVTGSPVLERVFREIVERDTRLLALSSTALVGLLLALFYRRWRPFVAVMLPLATAWALFAALLGLFDLPLNLFNLLAVPLVIGYGIDDHIFLIHRHLDDEARDPARTLATTGRAVVLTSASTIAGFAGLGIARFDGLRLFGLTGSLAVVVCLVGAFLVLPPLLTLLLDAADGTRTQRG